MPILNEKVYRDFSYEWEANNGNHYEYAMKLLHTEFGAVIQIILEDGTVELPAQMFTEISSFLINNGDVEGASSPMPKMSLPSKKTLSPAVMKPKLGVPVSTSNNPLIPREASFPLQTIQDQPPPTDVDPEEIMRQRMEAKAKASAARRGKVKGAHKSANDEEAEE